MNTHQQPCDYAKALHEQITDVASRIKNLEHVNRGHETALETLVEGYKIVLQEVRENRLDVERLFNQLATEKLEDAKRHAELLKLVGKGVFWLSAIFIMGASLQGIITGEPLGGSLLTMLKKLLGVE